MLPTVFELVTLRQIKALSFDYCVVVTLEHRKRFRDGDDETPARELAAGRSVARVRAVHDRIHLLYCNGACATWGVPHTFSGMDLYLTP